jgi:hypothetical protein
MAREEVFVPSPYTGEGISVQEFNVALDRYLTDGTGELDTYVRMSKKRLDKKINLYEGGNQGE